MVTKKDYDKWADESWDIAIINRVDFLNQRYDVLLESIGVTVDVIDKWSEMIDYKK